MSQKNGRNVCKKPSELEFAFLEGVLTGDVSLTKTAFGIQIKDFTTRLLMSQLLHTLQNNFKQGLQFMNLLKTPHLSQYIVIF